MQTFSKKSERVLLLLGCLSLLLFNQACSSKSAEDLNASSAAAANARWEQLPITIFSDSKLSANSLAMSDFFDAIEFWNNRAGRTLIVYGGEWKDMSAGQARSLGGSLPANVVFVDSAFQAKDHSYGETTLVSSEGDLKRTLIFVRSLDQYRFSSEDSCGKPSLRLILAHEFGHALGLNHINQSGHIMNSAIQFCDSLDDASVDAASLSSI